MAFIIQDHALAELRMAHLLAELKFSARDVARNPFNLMAGLIGRPNDRLVRAHLFDERCRYFLHKPADPVVAICTIKAPRLGIG